LLSQKLFWKKPWSSHLVWHSLTQADSAAGSAALPKPGKPGKPEKLGKPNWGAAMAVALKAATRARVNFILKVGCKEWLFCKECVVSLWNDADADADADADNEIDPDRRKG
jgi:hypothetical protein